MTDTMETTGSLNELILVESAVGIIRYIGPVHELKDKKEIWYGIEWKDPHRGKHDGSYKGTRYFHTKYPTSGSFVRPNKITFGIDIYKAVEEKYLEVEKIGNGEEEVLYNNFNINDKGITINCVVLAYSQISRLCPLNFFTETFPYMKELDLEGNLFNSWSQIFTILDHKGLKGLKLINVSNNLLELPETSKFAFEEKKFENIEHLIMNRMGYNWTNIEKILKHFPNLIELKICFNSIDKIEKSVDNMLLRKLKILDIESNPLNDWKDLKKFGALKELETLYANEIGISEISFEETDFNSKTEIFQKLKNITLNDNKINEWKSINELTKLPSLEEFTMKFNPLNNTAKSVSNMRQLVIAKMVNLKIFNRTKILADERKGSDIDYLKKFGKEWNATLCKTDSMTDNELILLKENFLKEHPSYLKLVEKYGAAEKGELIEKPTTLKSSLILLNIKDEQTGKIVRKKFPCHSEIQRLKLIFLKLFKYSASDLESTQLYYINSKNPSNEFEMENELRTLDFYSIENEDTVIVKRRK